MGWIKKKNRLTSYITSLVSVNGLIQLILFLVAMFNINMYVGLYDLLNNITFRLISSLIVYSSI